MLENEEIRQKHLLFGKGLIFLKLSDVGNPTVP